MAKTVTKKYSQRTKDVRVANSVEQWQSFEEWMSRYGFQNLTEGIRAAMNKIVESHNHTESQTNSPS